MNTDYNIEAKEVMWGSEALEGRYEPTEGAGAILYLGNNMVTTKMGEQIQYAAHAPPMFEYLRHQFEWIDNQVGSIN